MIPDERATRYPLATLYLQQTMQALVTLADEHGGRLPVRVNFLLDEFANLPAIKDFDHVVTVARGRGIRLLSWRCRISRSSRRSVWQEERVPVRPHKGEPEEPPGIRVRGLGVGLGFGAWGCYQPALRGWRAGAVI